MPDDTAPSPDDLADLRRQLQDIDEVPLDERPELFERLNRALADELSGLEEV